jgi:uncharacterized integral membrane protein
MLRVILIIVATMGVVAFSLANTQRVGLSFVVGNTEVRLIFLMMTSFGAGGFIAMLYQMVESAGRRAQRNRMRVAMKRTAMSKVPIE